MNQPPNNQVYYENWGLIDYKEAWDKQTFYFNRIIEIKLSNRDREVKVPTDNFLIFCQHPNVYTIGKSGRKENLLITDAGLEEKNATFYEINRGGDITFHGPGQIVGYPLFDLDNFFTDIHKYLRYLEEAVIRTCREYGLNAGRIEGLTGVWIGWEHPGSAGKICAMGIKASRWVTMHGFAFNTSPDLSYFENIIPCGITDKKVTSLEKELGRKVETSEVEQKLLKNLSEVFGIVFKKN